MIIKHVDADRVGQRLDNALLFWFKKMPRTLIYKLVRKGRIRVNGKRVSVSHRLALNDEVKCPVFVEDVTADVMVLDDMKRQWVRSWVLYQDDTCVVINKPAGIPVQKGEKDRFNVMDYCRAAGLGDQFFLVHRLDKPTSGCLLLALSRQAALTYSAQFKERSVEKCYRAIVKGRCSWRHKTIALRLLKGCSSSRDWVTIDQRGAEAVSHFTCLDASDQGSLLEVLIETGRTHQIRVHAASMQHPVWGDERYAANDELMLMRRAYPGKGMMLHALSLTFNLILDHKRVTIKAPLNQEFRSCLKQLNISE